MNSQIKFSTDPFQFDNFLLPVLHILNSKDYKRTEVAEKICDFYPFFKQITDASVKEHSAFEFATDLIVNRVGWAFTFLFKAEFIRKADRKYAYEITELGKKHLNAERITHKYLLENSPNYESNWQSNKKIDKIDIVDAVDNDEEEFKENAESELKKDFLSKIRQMDDKKFEKFCVALISKIMNGNQDNKIDFQESKGPDGGKDGAVYQDKYGFFDPIYIQAKRYGENIPVTPSAVDAFFGIMAQNNVNKGFFIITSHFSGKYKDIKKIRNLHLIDCDALFELCNKEMHGIRVREIIEIKEVAFDI